MKILCALGRCKHNSKGYYTTSYYGWCKLKQVKIDIDGCESANMLTDEEIEREAGGRGK